MKKLSVNEKLNKFKISYQRYAEESQRLLAFGYTEQEASQLILRKSSNKAVQSVLNNDELLLNAPYKLNHKQITFIASNDGGSRAIEAIKRSFFQLRGLGFTTAQIVSIAGHIGGSKNLDTVSTFSIELCDLGFTIDQITSIASHGEAEIAPMFQTTRSASPY